MSADQCVLDNGYVGRQGALYYEHGEDEGALPVDTFKEMMKGFTTDVASRYLDDNNISNHFRCIADLNEALHSEGIGSITVKGGLALRIVLDTVLEQWGRDVRGDERRAMDDARTYMMHTYASPSDLDTGLHIEDASRLGEATTLARDALVRLRDSWTDKDRVLQDIVSRCNDVSDRAVSDLQAAGHDAAAIVFIADKQADQDIRIVTPSDDAECPYDECNRVTLRDTHSIFISDNSGLVFKRGHNTADFHLTRAKWAVAAKVTRADGSVCVVNCPAELIDIAAPRGLDSRALQSTTKGLHTMKTYVDAAGVRVPAVNLKFQMLDVMEMVKQSMYGADDPKRGKRINRLVIMTVLKNIDGYNTALRQDDEAEVSKYDDFKVTTRWQDLMLTHVSNTDLVECVRYIDSLESSGETQLDAQLLKHLFAMRDVYVANERPTAMPFNARGGKNGGRNLVAGLVGVGVTIVMAMLPR